VEQWGDAAPTKGAAVEQLSVTEPARRTLAPAFRQVIVAVDRSAFADRAVRPALAVARRVGATVTAVTVIGEGDAVAGEDAGPAHWEGTGVESATIAGDDAGLAIIEFAAGRPGSLVCLASHSRRWPASSLIGSTAATVVAGSHEPVLVVGPNVEPGWELGDRVVACIDGEAATSNVLDVAVRWAALLDARLDVVIVEPPPVSPDGRRSDDPEGYLAGVVRLLHGRAAALGGQVIYDAIGPGPGIRSWSEADPAGLLVVANHSRPRHAEVPLGHRALQILHASALPVLVVPIPPAR
jgi:nucleotide-binding universal stress UspA family protein